MGFVAGNDTQIILRLCSEKIQSKRKRAEKNSEEGGKKIRLWGGYE